MFAKLKKFKGQIILFDLQHCATNVQHCATNVQHCATNVSQENVLESLESSNIISQINKFYKCFNLLSCIALCFIVLYCIV